LSDFEGYTSDGFDEGSGSDDGEIETSRAAK